MTSHIKPRLENFKKISWGEVIAIVTIILTVGSFALTRIDRQFDRIDRQFDRIDATLERIERDNRDFHGRLSHLEGKYERKVKTK
jgi:hypothetical protein